MLKKAIILAGGFGTRLQSVVNNVPKPMAPIQGKPFVVYLIENLLDSGFEEIILSLHYMPEIIIGYIKIHYPHAPIQFIIEPKPLGTGGAIQYVLEKSGITEPVTILNGDSFLQLDYQQFYQTFTMKNADLLMALRHVENSGRYGKVVVDTDNKILQFEEKSNAAAGFINAGIYLLNPNIFNNYPQNEVFSLENDFFKPHLCGLKASGYQAEGYFIDIGIPEDYQRAQSELI